MRDGVGERGGEIISESPLAVHVGPGLNWSLLTDCDQNDLGTPLPGVTLKLSEGEEGEVLVKTPSLFLGYASHLSRHSKIH